MIVTLAEAKEFLKIDPTNTSRDVFLQMQLDVITEAIENYCRRRFKAEDYVQTFYSEDYDRRSYTIETAVYPLISVASVTQDGGLITDSYRVNKATGTITRPEGWFFGKETVISYRAGYEVVPAVVKWAALSLLQERNNKDLAGVPLNFGSDVQSVSIPGTISIQFDYTLQNNERSSSFGVILGTYANALDYYRTDRAVIGSGKLAYVG